MAETIGTAEFSRMLLGAAGQIRAHHEQLSKLDSAIGDGDHGTAMMKAADAMERAVAAAADRPLKTLLTDTGWGMMGTDSGSTGPLLGSLFMGMSEAVGDSDQLDGPALADVFAGGLAGLCKQTRAQVGDKTMMDALVPAVEALRVAADGSASVAEALRRAAEAARQGAEATAEMQAAFGRAKNLGERTLGHVDPGATSMAYLFAGFAEAAAT